MSSFNAAAAAADDDDDDDVSYSVDVFTSSSERETERCSHQVNILPLPCVSSPTVVLIVDGR